jgi:hypothetical protein
MALQGHTLAADDKSSKAPLFHLFVVDQGCQSLSEFFADFSR